MNKANDDILIHPERGKNENNIPPCGILFVNPSEARIAMQMVLDEGGHKQFLFHSELTINKDFNFFVAGPAIGAPMAVMTLEKLIALGAKTVLLFGWCGSINPNLRVGDILSGGVAHCGEGTSRYYSSETVCHASSRFVERVQSCFELSTSKAIWSTDAVYRESRRMFKELADKYDVCGVDMEYSALCAVATFRKIDFAALFIVSDELWKDEWRPGFVGKVFKRRSKAQIKRLIQHIVSLSLF